MGGAELMIKEERDGCATWLILDRQERLNAFTAQGYRALRIALERSSADDSTRVVVLTGRGRAFSVGADRSLLDPTSTANERQNAGDEFFRLLEVLASFEKPLFAAVNGLAVGFGVTMLLYCDVVLVAETARLRLPFTELGIVPEAGSSVLLPARVGWAQAMWTLLSSEWVDAPQALRMGLALRIVPDSDLHDQTAGAAASVAARDPLAVAATKRLMTAGRAEVARRAIARELEEMSVLGGRPSG
jgi:enoyl-CoA hydratase/carnithine racemase